MSDTHPESEEEKKTEASGRQETNSDPNYYNVMCKKKQTKI